MLSVFASGGHFVEILPAGPFGGPTLSLDKVGKTRGHSPLGEHGVREAACVESKHFLWSQSERGALRLCGFTERQYWDVWCVSFTIGEF